MKAPNLIILAAITISIATAVILTVNNSDHPPPPAPSTSRPAAATRPTSRFLQQREKNPRAADHCNRDNEICSHITAGTNTNTTCCNNKCIDLKYNDDNCGACKRKCAFTETCCRGECVDLAYDKRHCGYCNHRCMPGGYCIYGMCDYA